MSPIVTHMHCKGCHRSIGDVHDGRLYLAGIEIRGGVLVCPSCGRDCPWYPQKRQKATGAPVKAHSGA